ncbi:hypothetical protein P692DRAFT_20709488, partial [Suillus brevipes Sb2]
MVGTVHTDSDDEPCVVRPVRKVKPTAALLEHSEKAALPSQTRAINAFRAAEALKRTTDDTHPLATEPPQAPIPTTHAPNINTTAPETTSKRARVEEIDGDEISGDDEREDARTNPKCKRVRRKKAAKAQEDVDEDGILADIDVQPIIDESTSPTREDRTRDIDQFFSQPFESTHANGKVKKHRKTQCTIVNETSTLRRHAEAKFAGKYRTWAKANAFTSKLPGDIAAEK